MSPETTDWQVHSFYTRSDPAAARAEQALLFLGMEGRRQALAGLRLRPLPAPGIPEEDWLPPREVWWDSAHLRGGPESASRLGRFQQPEGEQDARQPGNLSPTCTQV